MRVCPLCRTVTCDHIEEHQMELMTGTPHRHNTIPESAGFIRKRTAWRCIGCHELFDVRPDPTPDWAQQCDLDREDAIQFERDVHRDNLDWDARDVAWTDDERGPIAWVGCKSIHVISEEP